MFLRIAVHLVIYTALVLQLSAVSHAHEMRKLLDVLSGVSVLQNRLSEYRDLAPTSEHVYLWALVLTPVSISVFLGDRTFRKKILDAEVDNENHTKLAAVVILFLLAGMWFISIENASGRLKMLAGILVGWALPITYFCINLLCAIGLITLFRPNRLP